MFDQGGRVPTAPRCGASEAAEQNSRRTGLARGSVAETLRLPLDAKICERQVCGEDGFSTYRPFPGTFLVYVVLRDSERTSATPEIVHGFVATAGIAGWGNGWLAGLGLLALDLVSWDLSV